MIPSQNEWLEVLKKRHGNNLQKRFSDATVAVCGLGGLGSNIAVCLARVGIGRLILIDFDKVDISNLHRQQYSVDQIGMYKTKALSEYLLSISPYTKIKAVTKKITTENYQQILKDAQIICEAFDDANEKSMLVNSVLETMPEKFLVAASGMAGLGTANAIRTRKITPHFYVCGDEISDVNDSIGLLSTRVMLCAASQAHTVLRIIAEKYDV